MNKLLSCLVLFGIIGSGCSNKGDKLGKVKLQNQFENIWWELIDPPKISGFSSPSCVYFDSINDSGLSKKGDVLYIEKGDPLTYRISYFTRVDDGYELSEQNAKVYIYDVDDGYFTSKVVIGIISDQID